MKYQALCLKPKQERLNCMFHFKIQLAKCHPSPILFTCPCYLSLQEVDYKLN